MKSKVIIVVFMLLFVRLATMGQSDFDSIRICHDKEGNLKQVTIGEYQVMVEHGKLLSFYSKDQLVNYDEARHLMMLKERGMKPDEFLSFQLTADGILISTKDKTVTVNSPAALVPGFAGTANDTTMLLKIDRFQVPVSFKFNRPDRINFAINNKHLSMLLHQGEGTYSWDFNLETLPDSSSVTFASVYNKPYFLTIQDNKNKVSVRLFANKKNGVYDILEGRRMYEPNKYGVDFDYVLHYTMKGKLKKGHSKFNLDCTL